MARNKDFKGSLTALLTPFREDGTVDLAALGRFIDWQIDEGTAGLIPAGTTGESPTLTHDEHALVVAHTVKVSGGRVPVMAGAGSNSTHEAIGMARHAKAVGADALLVVAPYYNKPTQEGLYQHFMLVADATDLPLYVYNVPGRSVVEVLPETMARLAKHPNIVGTKDATANLSRPLQLRALLGDAPFTQLTGDDGTTVSFLAAGGTGCISVTANIAPKLCAAMHEAWQAGEVAKAMQIQQRLTPLHDAMFCESNPGPVKYAASRLGLCTPTVRLPLCEPGAASRAVIDEALKKTGLSG
ncbi:4-hydroxy-tetrahydrodipicolinate synthase [Asaia bogorensis]|uniref:4-hydroxy-tetrahydrodipicolinate synthase n=1 Tax=Asaia bogorensis NBRC 16594 TaxID=1231624 RepID=A0AAN4R671_9PROT|nr:4-hydroxy-tetrahydrodipicolinate synthase [Asaia bogorensis]BAT19413.1 dihydrodipicolinate synthase [Asaia bogorensis NBRC 16594]GBQ81887.1 dihydrodipicolinate synthase [Asaia bogorensis NBRC 16594]GEL54091.1 4-hydroxy-tetrahydrodipicolinate synthase [Asaia bogorensis NBRC 16594]